MSPAEFPPPFTAPSDVVDTVRRQGFAVAGSSWVRDLAGASLPEGPALARNFLEARR